MMRDCFMQREKGERRRQLGKKGEIERNQLVITSQTQETCDKTYRYTDHMNQKSAFLDASHFSSLSFLSFFLFSVQV